MRFSQRAGLLAVNDVIQSDGINDALRNSLWNVLDLHFWSREGFKFSRYGGDLGDIDGFSRRLWFHFFKRPVDSRPRYGNEILNEIRKYFFGCKWHEVYDFIEYVCQANGTAQLRRHINDILERELSGYRLIDDHIVPVTDEAEKKAIEEALEPGPYAGVEAHLRQALQHLANRDNPDFRNSIKESISAVESLACELTKNPKATLGEALQTLEREGQLHGALKKGFSSLYGYTSDADGIRHAMLDEAALDIADAKYFLVSCSAFVNYLKAKHAKAHN